MIADQKIFTVKKSQESQAAFTLIGILILLLTGLMVARDFSLSVALFAMVFQGGLLFSLVHIYRKTGQLVKQVSRGKQSAKRFEAELAGLRKSSAAKTHFIETAGAELLEASRAMYDAAEFLHAKHCPVGNSVTGREIEEDLLENAGWVYSFSRDIVVLTQLKKGDVRLFEQEINPVELTRFCASEVSKKQVNQQIIEVVRTPGQQLLLKGDLSKLKQLLEKFLTWAIRHIQIDGAKVQVSIFYDKASWLVFSIKLSGCHMTASEFEKFCCPLDSLSNDGEQVDLGMAIARGLAELHGGDIVIGEQTSSGTVLNFFLPSQRVSQIVSLDERQQSLEMAIGTVR